jgi:Uma2 family endonuclease
MSALPKKHWTVEEYLSFERGSDEKHEFIDGNVYAMSGGSANHSALAGGIYATLFTQLFDRPCTPYTSDLRVKINHKDYTYPDVSVVCGPAQFERDTTDILLNPVIIVEVLSPSTEKYDRGRKFQLYRTLPSMREYVLVSQDTARIERYLRHENHQWLYSDAVGLEAVLELPSIECVLRLSEVYKKVVFEDSGGEVET